MRITATHLEVSSYATLAILRKPSNASTAAVEYGAMIIPVRTAYRSAGAAMTITILLVRIAAG